VDNAEAPSIFVSGWQEIPWFHGHLDGKVKLNEINYLGVPYFQSNNFLQICFKIYFWITPVCFYRRHRLIRFVAAGGVNIGATVIRVWLFDLVESVVILSKFWLSEPVSYFVHLLCLGRTIEVGFNHQLRRCFEIFKHFLCFWSKSWLEMYAGHATNIPVESWRF
jgi:hypothetical protein